MVLTPSNMLALGAPAPSFKLLEVLSGQLLTLPELKGEKATVIMFICNHCPYVKHINTELVKLPKDYKPSEVSFIAINSNDAKSYPQDGPDKMKETALELGYEFPYLFDETQAVARSYQAACTPDFYVFDQNLQLSYRGQLDDSRPGNHLPVTGKDLREAIECLISGKPVATVQKPSIGCNIKWRA